MEFVSQAVDAFMHLDTHLYQLAAQYGIWLYAILWLIIFCETGLVVTPILPGDSLLFAAGALASSDESGLNIAILIVLLSIAAVLGTLNCHWTLPGPKVFKHEKSRFSTRHLHRTALLPQVRQQDDRAGRFVPIVRCLLRLSLALGDINIKILSLQLSWVAWFGSLGFCWLATSGQLADCQGASISLSGPSWSFP